MARPLLMTQRIRLVPMKPEHLPHLVELDSDPEVLKFILGRARSRDEVQDFWGPVCAETDADAVGLGWWVGFRREDDDFLGWWDLSPEVPVPRQPTRAEAGWRLVRRHWRQGYATEGAAALLQHGFDTVGLRTVWAETMAVNQPSRSVMAKLGMRHIRTDHRSWDNPLPGAEQGEVVYEVTRAEWLSRRGTSGMPNPPSDP
jgi:RimJ/RimL family protein N-acetyltransferase